MQPQGSTAQNSSKLGWVLAAAMSVIALGQCSSNNSPDNSGAAGITMYVQAPSLNCRAGASQTEEVVRSLSHNDAVRILEDAADWMRVDGSPDCWVASRYLSPTASAISEQPPSPPAQASGFLSSHDQPPQRRYDPPQEYEPPSSFSGGGSVYYANCSAARAAGAAPVRRGDPGYARKLDRDGDGVGCE
jgi:hypothetical protein